MIQAKFLKLSHANLTIGAYHLLRILITTLPLLFIRKFRASIVFNFLSLPGNELLA